METAGVRETALVPQNVDEDAIAPFLVQPVDRCLENAVVVHHAELYPIQPTCGLGDIPEVPHPKWTAN